MFNTSGTELLVILLVALIVLGPEKLPEAARKVGNVVRELRRMSSGFQAEVRDALAEPMAMVNDTVSTVKSGWTEEPAATARPATGEDGVRASAPRPVSPLPPPDGPRVDLPPPPA